MAHTPKNQSEKAILTARRAWCYLVLVLISFLCLFFFYVLVINSTRTHFEIQKGFSLVPGKSIVTNLRNVLTDANIPVMSGIRNSLLVSACSAALSVYFSALTAYGMLNGVTVTIDGSDNMVDVMFDVVEEKTLPVTVTTNYLTISDGYILYSTEVSKDMVTLSGPSSELDKVTTCTAEVTYSGELDSSVTLATPLRFYTSGGTEVNFEYTELEESSVDVTLQVYKMATLPVNVSFINAPRDFDASVLVYELSRKQLKVAGPAEKIDALSTLSIGTIDLSTFTLNKVYELPIELPSDIYLLDNISTITLSFDCSGLETKTMNLPSSCVQVVNLPSTYQLTVETERLMNVTLCGPKAALETLTPEQVVVEIDAEDFSVATGQQNIACRLYVPSNGKIFALGSYVLQCRIESN